MIIDNIVMLLVQIIITSCELFANINRFELQKAICQFAQQIQTEQPDFHRNPNWDQNSLYSTHNGYYRLPMKLARDSSQDLSGTATVGSATLCQIIYSHLSFSLV